MAEKKERETVVHEQTETVEERLMEYGYLGIAKVGIRYADNNKPRMKKREG